MSVLEFSPSPRSSARGTGERVLRNGHGETTASERGLGFQNAPLDRMLAIGAVSERQVRIWVRVPEPGRYQLRWSCAERGGAVHRTNVEVADDGSGLTGSTTIAEGLEPNCRYRVALYGDIGEQLANGSFVTAPADPADMPLRFSLALMSCHQPFDADGGVAETTEPILEAAYRAFSEHEVRQVIMGGDQLYSDYPPKLSLFNHDYFARIAPAGRERLLDCSEDEVRGLFHGRYRHFWNLPGWRKLMANFPCYPILDDHEIVDNWGSAVEHRQSEWQAYRDGAFKAYWDYQGSLVRDHPGALPDHLDYPVVFGDIATYVMDLRSNRRVGDDPRVVSPEQMASFGNFLAAHSDKRVLFVVLSVPLVHLPAFLSKLGAAITPDGEDFSDRWSSRGHGRDRNAVLRLLHDHQARHPDQRIVLLSGDIHIGCLHQVHWRDRRPNLYQFVSSGITHDTGRVVQTLSSWIMRAHRRLKSGEELKADFRLLRGERGASRNPCGRLNFGIIEVSRETPDAVPSLRFLLYTHRGSRPVCQYRSPLIGAAAASDVD